MRSDRPNVTDPGRVIAHRGASRVAPENSLDAFRAAAEQGVHWVEFDVSLLGDGTPVVHHDATLDRCTTGRGPLTAIGAGDLADMRLSNGESLPTLEAALDLLDALGFHANLEMKPHDEPVGRMSGIVADMLEARPWCRDRVITSSFNHGELAAFRARMPAMALAALYEEPAPDWRGILARLDAVALHVDHRFVSVDLLREAGRAGVDVRVYTTNEPARMAAFRDAGLTSVITDHPPLFLDDPDWAAWARN